MCAGVTICLADRHNPVRDEQVASETALEHQREPREQEQWEARRNAALAAEQGGQEAAAAAAEEEGPLVDYVSSREPEVRDAGGLTDWAQLHEVWRGGLKLSSRYSAAILRQMEAEGEGLGRSEVVELAGRLEDGAAEVRQSSQQAAEAAAGSSEHAAATGRWDAAITKLGQVWGDNLPQIVWAFEQAHGWAVKVGVACL